MTDYLGGRETDTHLRLQCPGAHWQLVKEAGCPTRGGDGPWGGRESGKLLSAHAQEFQKYGTESGPQYVEREAQDTQALRNSAVAHLGLSRTVPQPGETQIPEKEAPALSWLDFCPQGSYHRGLQRTNYLLLTSVGTLLSFLLLSSQDTDLYGVIHQSLQQQRLPSSSRGQQGPGQRRHRACLGQLTACPGTGPARPTGLSPRDLQGGEKWKH